MFYEMRAAWRGVRQLPHLKSSLSASNGEVVSYLHNRDDTTFFTRRRTTFSGTGSSEFGGSSAGTIGYN
jgi:hypothetical protein